MARRNRNLAGLAALGALGYALTRGGKEIPVEDRKGTPVEGPVVYDDDREPGGSTVGFPSIRPAAPASVRSMAPAAADADEVPGAGYARQVYERDVKERGRDKSVVPMTRKQPTTKTYERKMGATAEEIAAYRNREVTPPPMTPEMRRQAEAQALERVDPLEYVIGGPGLKTLQAAAKGLANRAPAMREMTQQALPAPTRQLTGPSKADLMARDRAAREAARREEMLRENASRYGLNPEAPGYTGAAQAVRERLGGDAFTVKKKGGAVKAKKMASGGMTSASKRGDGIAKKGKTKCKMY